MDREQAHTVMTKQQHACPQTPTDVCVLTSEFPYIKHVSLL